MFEFDELNMLKHAYKIGNMAIITIMNPIISINHDSDSFIPHSPYIHIKKEDFYLRILIIDNKNNVKKPITKVIICDDNNLHVHLSNFFVLLLNSDNSLYLGIISLFISFIVDVILNEHNRIHASKQPKSNEEKVIVIETIDNNF